MKKAIITVDRVAVTLSTTWDDGRLVTVLHAERRIDTIVCAARPRIAVDEFRKELAAAAQQRVAEIAAGRLAKSKTFGELREILAWRMNCAHGGLQQ